MRLSLRCIGFSSDAHALVARAIRQVIPEAQIDELDDQRCRRLDPVVVSALASVISAACAAAAVVLQVIQLRRGGHHATANDVSEAIVRVEVTLNQKIEVSVRKELATELQKLPDPVRLFLPNGDDYYLVDIAPREHSIEMEGRPAAEIKKPPP